MFTVKNVKSFKKIFYSDKNLIALQDNVQNFLQQIVNLELLNYILLKDIQLLFGKDNIINHLLKRDLIGFFVIRQNAQSNIWDNQAANNRPDLTLILNCSLNCTVSLIVF